MKPNKPETTREEKVAIMKQLFLAHLVVKKTGDFVDIRLSKKEILTLSLAMTHLWVREHGARDFQDFDMEEAFKGGCDGTE